jgi:hypothetical protein
MSTEEAHHQLYLQNYYYYYMNIWPTLYFKFEPALLVDMFPDSSQFIHVSWEGRLIIY